MALTESIEYDKIEVVGEYKNIQVRKATVIKRDGVEISGSRSYERYTLTCGSLDASDNLVGSVVKNSGNLSMSGNVGITISNAGSEARPRNIALMYIIKT